MSQRRLEAARAVPTQDSALTAQLTLCKAGTSGYGEANYGCSRCGRDGRRAASSRAASRTYRRGRYSTSPPMISLLPGAQTPRTGALERKALEKEILCVSTREEEKRPPLCIQPWARAARPSNVEEKNIFLEALRDPFLEKH